MSKTYKEQAVWDYIHSSRQLSQKLLKGVKNYFERCNYNRLDQSCKMQEL